MEHAYRIGAFAALAGVSVRTLHRYDHLGLVRSEGRTEGSQRLSTRHDLLRLLQVLTLRSLGFPLKRIGEPLAMPEFDLVAAICIQRQALVAASLNSRASKPRWKRCSSGGPPAASGTGSW